MRPLVARELTVIARTPGFWSALATYVVGLAAFVMIWGDGVPVHGGRPVFDQFLSLQLALLSVVLPWAALRCSSPAGADGAVAIALAAGYGASRVVVARCMGLTIALTLMAAAALPLTLIVQQVSALPLSHSLAAQVPLAGLALFAAVVSTACALLIRNRLGSWIAATAATLAATLVIPEGAVAAAIAKYGGLAVVVLLAIALWAARSAAYCSEERT